MSPWGDEEMRRDRGEDRRTRCRELAAALSERAGRGGAPVTVVRHSVREKIAGASLAAATAAALTDEGRELARYLARALPEAASYRLFASPVARCVDTATELADALRVRGVAAGLQAKRTYLAGDFIRDPAPLVETFATGGPRGFMHAWYGGALPDGAVDPPRRAARDMLVAILAEQETGPAVGLDLHVGHDLTVATLLGLFMDVTGDAFTWPGYLEGVILWRDGPTLKLWWRGADHRVELTV